MRLFGLEKLQEQIIFVIAVAIFILINFLLAPLTLRWDLSAGQAYTLTPATKKVLKNLDDIVTIKFYVSSDLPARLQPLKTEVVDLLREYEKYNKIQLKIIDPKKDDKAEQEARESGIPQIQFSQLEKDKYAVSAGYFGIALSYGSKLEIIPQVTDISSLEYNLTAAIYKLTRKELPKIGLIGPEISFDIRQDPLGLVKEVISRQFAIEPITIATGSAETIDQNYRSVLVVDSENKEFNDLEIKALRQYLKGKGTAIFFVNGQKVTDNLQTKEPAKNLLSLIADYYGINIQPNLLLSASAELVNFGNDLESFLTLYPFWLRTNVFNTQTGYFSNISQLTFPWVSALNFTKKPNVNIVELVKTTKQTWEQKGSFTLNPQLIPQPQKEDLKEFIIVAQANIKDGGKIVVIPSERFIVDRFLARNSGNVEFVLNILNNFASEGALIGIRQRVVRIYPLPEIPDIQKDLFKYANILFLPGVFGLFGIIRLYQRK